MEIPVLIEPADKGFRAIASLFQLSAEGGTRQEALARLRELIQEKMNAGAELMALRLQTPDNPWLAIAGTHDPTDPIVQEWKEILAERRLEDR